MTHEHARMRALFASVLDVASPELAARCKPAYHARRLSTAACIVTRSRTFLCCLPCSIYRPPRDCLEMRPSPATHSASWRAAHD